MLSLSTFCFITILVQFFFLEGRDGCNKKDCNSQDDAVVRACDIDPQLLLAGCNPECANGGTCNNGTCICPVGITGKACNEGKLVLCTNLLEITFIEGVVS